MVHFPARRGTAAGSGIADQLQGVMRPMRRFFLFVSLVAFSALAVAGTSLAAQAGTSGFTLVQDATLVHPGSHSSTAAEASSTGSPFTWGGVGFPVPAAFTLNQLNNLATDYKFALGSCWGGSPRFEAWVTNVTGTHKIFFYLGPGPSYVGCPSGAWVNSGNVASPTSPVDATQLGGGWAEPYSAVQASYGNDPVTGVYLDVDGGWDSSQTVDFDNTQVNSSLFTYEK